MSRTTTPPVVTNNALAKDFAINGIFEHSNLLKNALNATLTLSSCADGGLCFTEQVFRCGDNILRWQCSATSQSFGAFLDSKRVSDIFRETDVRLYGTLDSEEKRHLSERIGSSKTTEKNLRQLFITWLASYEQVLSESTQKAIHAGGFNLIHFFFPEYVVNALLETLLNQPLFRCVPSDVGAKENSILFSAQEGSLVLTNNHMMAIQLFTKDYEFTSARDTQLSLIFNGNGVTYTALKYTHPTINALLTSSNNPQTDYISLYRLMKALINLPEHEITETFTQLFSAHIKGVDHHTAPIYNNSNGTLDIKKCNTILHELQSAEFPFMLCNLFSKIVAEQSSADNNQVQLSYFIFMSASLTTTYHVATQLASSLMETCGFSTNQKTIASTRRAGLYPIEKNTVNAKQGLSKLSIPAGTQPI